MIFPEQLSRYRKEAKMTQEELAEKCDVTRQAVAKWENGESVPDVYKISQIAGIFNVSLEMLVWGEDKAVSANAIARDIYMQFVENFEQLKHEMRYWSGGTKKSAAIKLRTSIKKARIVFPKRTVDELYDLAEDFGVSCDKILKREKYQPCFSEENMSEVNTSEIYIKDIIPTLYEKVEKLLEDYLDLPK